jgi:hypothetical protein
LNSFGLGLGLGGGACRYVIIIMKMMDDVYEGKGGQKIGIGG